MKKVIIYALASVLLVYCSKPSNSTVELSIASSSMGQNTPAGIGVQKIVDTINASGDDSIKAVAFFDTQLGQAASLLQSLQQGSIDIGVAGNAYFSSVVPELQVLELPYIFQDYDDARQVVDGEIGSNLLEMLDSKGVKGLKFWEIGFRQLSNNKKPVNSVEDVKGLKLRSLPSAIQIKIWESYGALPSPLDSAELYTALQQGVFDGQENPISEIVSKKMYEVQKYVSLTSHVYTPMVLAISQKTWTNLTDAQKTIVEDAVIQGTIASRNAVDIMEKDGITLLKEKGINVIEEPNKESFKKASQPVYDIFKENYSGDILETILNRS